MICGFGNEQLIADRQIIGFFFNSVFIKSAPFSLQTLRKGGSLTSSIGASNRGKSPNSMLAIFAI